MTLVIKTTGIEEYLGNAEGAYVKCLMLGTPSAGKTRSASFWPKPIFADCEKGRMSIADRGVPYGEVLSTQDMDILLRHVEADCKKPRAERKYLTLVIDTVDAYQRIVIAERLRAVNREGLNGFEDWGHLDAKMTGLTTRLMKMPINLVLNCHLTEKTDDADAVTYAPKLKGDIRTQLPADFDLVGWMKTRWGVQTGPNGVDQKALVRVVQWQPEPGFMILKDRSGQLPKETSVVFSEQDYEGLYTTMFGANLDSMSDGVVLETLEAPELTDVVAPGPGGPVAPHGALPAKTAAAKKATVPKTEPEARTRTTITHEPKPAPEPEPEPDVTSAPSEALARAKAAATGTETEPAPESEIPVATPVAAAEVPSSSTEPTVEAVASALGGQVISTESTTEQVEKAQGTPPTANGDAPVVTCGTPTRSIGTKTPVPGCGKSLAGEDRDIVNIGVLKTKTLLCTACLTAWRAENETKKVS